MEKVITLSLLSAVVFFAFTASGRSSDLAAKKILMIIAKADFRNEELFVPKKIFEENGLSVTVASSTLNVCHGMLGGEIRPDMLIDKAAVDDYDVIIFVGGGGASEYWDSNTAHKIAKEAIAKNKILAAICIAPVTLANAGVLSGKKATVWPSEKDTLTKKGARYTGAAVELDGDIITANGPQSASEFAKAILTKLKG